MFKIKKKHLFNKRILKSTIKATKDTINTVNTRNVVLTSITFIIG